MSPDYIVVGAGTAGCAVAGALAARGARVLVLEAGGGDRALPVRIPAAFAKLFRTGRDWAFQTEAQPHLDGRSIFWPRGKMIGGSSAMNAQIHQWGAPDDFARWATPGWSWDDMAPALREADAALNGGPLRDPHPLTRAFITAAHRDGLCITGRYNGGALREGAWIADVTHHNGVRRTAADGFLKPALRRGVAVRTRAHVLRIAFAGRRAEGVVVHENGRETTHRAARGVILAAGAVNTPHLLMLSGVGDAAALARHGVGVVADAPEVGRNLQDHLMLVTHHATARRDTLKSAEAPHNLLRYLFARRGPLASNVAEGVAFFASRTGGPIDLEFVFAPVLFENEGLSPPSAHGFSVAVVLLQPDSRGQIKLAGGAPGAAPLIDPNYLGERADLDRLVLGLKRATRLLSHAPLADDRAQTRPPVALDDATLADAVRAHAHTIYHPVGTCRMGVDAGSVVDPGLKVRGVEGLWAADASVMPTIVSGHPNATVAAIGLRAADLIGRAGQR